MCHNALGLSFAKQCKLCAYHTSPCFADHEIMKAKMRAGCHRKLYHSSSDQVYICRVGTKVCLRKKELKENCNISVHFCSRNILAKMHSILFCPFWFSNFGDFFSFLEISSTKVKIFSMKNFIFFCEHFCVNEIKTEPYVHT
jgi:hypothetical protein